MHFFCNKKNAGYKMMRKRFMKEFYHNCLVQSISAPTLCFVTPSFSFLKAGKFLKIGEVY